MTAREARESFRVDENTPKTNRKPRNKTQTPAQQHSNDSNKKDGKTHVCIGQCEHKEQSVRLRRVDPPATGVRQNTPGDIVRLQDRTRQDMNRKRRRVRLTATTQTIANDSKQQQTTANNNKQQQTTTNNSKQQQTTANNSKQQQTTTTTTTTTTTIKKKKKINKNKK